MRVGSGDIVIKPNVAEQAARVARAMAKEHVQIRRWLRQLGLDPAQDR